MLSRLATRIPRVSSRLSFSPLSSLSSVVSCRFSTNAGWTAAQLPKAPKPITGVKPHTQYTGLDVVPNAREVLIGLYKETLRLLATYEKNQFNETSRKWAAYRLGIVEKCKTVDEIEAYVDGDEAEEMIRDAENELDLLVLFNEEVRPWQYMDNSDLEYPNSGHGIEEHQVNTPHGWMSAEEENKAWAEIDKELGYEGHQIKGPLHGFTGTTMREAIIYARKNFNNVQEESKK